MVRRVAIMIEEDLNKKSQSIPSKKMQKQNSTYGYSKVANDIRGNPIV